MYSAARLARQWIKERSISCFVKCGFIYLPARLARLARQSVDQRTKYIAISKNVVRENDECQLSNGNCTTEKKCGY